MKTKTYVITGSASGIGKALLKELAADNVIFAAYRNPEHEQLLKEISPNIYPFYIDYSKPETIKLASEYIISKCTKVNTLINVAGCVVAGPIESIDINEIRHQFDVNVFGHLEFSQKLIEILNGGRIINISSMASFGIFPFIAPYCASKNCLDMFFNSWLLETKKNIKIISIKPGVISTPLWAKSIKENTKTLDNCFGYVDEMRFLVANALKNEKDGLPVEQVVKIILKADRDKNPKLSYVVGKDAFVANLVSKLPQRIKNNLVRWFLQKRLAKQ